MTKIQPNKKRKAQSSAQVHFWFCCW